MADLKYPSLEAARRRFEGGDDRALMDAIDICAMFRCEMPQWVADNFRERYRRISEFEASKWDDAFGSPFPKGMKVKDARRRYILQERVYNRIIRIREKTGHPIGEELFDRVGKKLGIATDLCSRLYYAHLRIMQENEREIDLSRRKSAL